MKNGYMKHKKIFFIAWFVFVVALLVITAVADTVIPSSEFENENFCQYVRENFDINRDGLQQQSESDEVIDIRLSDYPIEISSIKGMEYFMNLRLMHGYGDKLESFEPIGKSYKSGKYSNNRHIDFRFFAFI